MHSSFEVQVSKSDIAEQYDCLIKTYIPLKWLKITEQVLTSTSNSTQTAPGTPNVEFFLKDDFCLSPYLLSVISSHLRRIMTKLRNSAHKLEVEVGRHKRPTPVPAQFRLVYIAG